MSKLIQQSFAHRDDTAGEGGDISEGKYDLTGPDGEIILPSLWGGLVRPGWEVTMKMWKPKPTEKMPIKFKDAIGRKFSFPFHLCQTWTVSAPSSLQSTVLAYLIYLLLNTHFCFRAWKNSSNRASYTSKLLGPMCMRATTTFLGRMVKEFCQQFGNGLYSLIGPSLCICGRWTGSLHHKGYQSYQRTVTQPECLRLKTRGAH